MTPADLKGHAHHVLRLSFEKDLQELVNAYTEAGAGLDDLCLAELHTFPDNTGKGAVSLNIYVDWPAPGIFGPNHRGSCGHGTVLEGLEDARAERLYVGGYLAFEKKDGEWQPVDPDLTS